MRIGSPLNVTIWGLEDDISQWQNIIDSHNKEIADHNNTIKKYQERIDSALASLKILRENSNS